MQSAIHIIVVIPTITHIARVFAVSEITSTLSPPFTQLVNSGLISLEAYPGDNGAFAIGTSYDVAAFISKGTRMNKQFIYSLLVTDFLQQGNQALCPPFDDNSLVIVAHYCSPLLCNYQLLRRDILAPLVLLPYYRQISSPS